jgi:hypothetical protein
MKEIVIATTVPHTMDKKTCGLIFASRTFINQTPDTRCTWPDVTHNHKPGTGAGPILCI